MFKVAQISRYVKEFQVPASSYSKIPPLPHSYSIRESFPLGSDATGA